MKRLPLILLIVIATNNSGFSQAPQSKEDCLKNKDAPLVYIPGYKDCIVDRYSNTILRINPEILKNGFELKINPEYLKRGLELKEIDTSIKVISFVFTFDFSDGLAQIPSTGNKILPRNDSIISFSKIVEAQLITIDRIKLSIGTRNVLAPSLVLYSVKD